MSFSQFAAKTKFAFEKHSPELCLAGGIIGFGVTIFLACKATMRSSEVLDEYTAVKEEIKKAKEASVDPEIPEDKRPEYTPEQVKHDEAIAFRNLVVGMAKKYWPVALSGALSIGLLLTSYKIINGRLVGAIGAYTALDEGFRKYRSRVADVVGEEKEREIRTGVTKEKGFVKEVNDVGEEEVKEKDVDVMKGDPSDYEGVDVVLWSRETVNGPAFQEGDQTYNRTFLQMVENSANDQLFSKGYLFEKDVMEQLGMTPTPESCLKGWIIDPANPPKSVHPICFHTRALFKETGDKVLHDGRIVNGCSGWAYTLEFDTHLIWNLIGIYGKR